MTNAQQLMQAIIYRMSQHAEIVTLRGSPLIERIYWKTQ
jgi:hypothetical protein